VSYNLSVLAAHLDCQKHSKSNRPLPQGGRFSFDRNSPFGLIWSVRSDLWFGAFHSHVRRV
jgi:hypothetical protein